MVSRRAGAARLALLAPAILLAGCATPELDAEGAAAAAVDAFGAAGLDASNARDARREPVDVGDGLADVWLLELDVEGEEWTVGVDPDRGAVVRTFEPEGSELSPAQADALVSHRGNDAARDARRTQRAAAVVALGALGAGGYLALRAAARREARNPVVELAEPDD